MQYIRSRIEDIKSLSLEDKLILFVAFALFLPMYASTICIASVTIYALFKKNLISSIKHQTGAKFLYAFCLLEIVVSLFYANSIGVINALGMLLIGAYVAYYRDHISSKVFDLMIEMILLLSLIITAFGLFEFNYYSQLADHSFFDLSNDYKELEIAISKLTDKQRYVIVNHYYKNQPLGKIAKQLKMNKNAVYQLKVRALLSLKRFMED